MNKLSGMCLSWLEGDPWYMNVNVQPFSNTITNYWECSSLFELVKFSTNAILLATDEQVLWGHGSMNCFVSIRTMFDCFWFDFSLCWRWIGAILCPKTNKLSKFNFLNRKKILRINPFISHSCTGSKIRVTHTFIYLQIYNDTCIVNLLQFYNR